MAGHAAAATVAGLLIPLVGPVAAVVGIVFLFLDGLAATLFGPLRVKL